MFEKCRGPFEFHWSGIRHGWRPQRFGMCFVVLMRSNRRGLSFLHWPWYRYVSTVSMAKPKPTLRIWVGAHGLSRFNWPRGSQPCPTRTAGRASRPKSTAERRAMDMNVDPQEGADGSKEKANVQFWHVCRKNDARHPFGHWHHGRGVPTQVIGDRLDDYIAYVIS